MGQEWHFQRGDIVDWMYVDNKAHAMYGNYTTCAELTHAPASDVAQLKKLYGLDCQR